MRAFDLTGIDVEDVETLVMSRDFTSHEGDD